MDSHPTETASLDLSAETRLRDSNTYERSETKNELGVHSTHIHALGSTTKEPKRLWQIGHKLPSLLLLLLFGSLALAIGHHVYYSQLGDDLVQSSSQQTWALRLGTGAAVLVKTALVAIIGMVGVQQIWATLRRKAMTIGGIDSVFEVLQHPIAIFNWDMICNAKLVALFALASWLMPLVVVFTPATLSVESKLSNTTSSGIVPTTNFANSTGWARYGGAGFVIGPSSGISRMFAQVYSANEIMPLPKSYTNATYNISFWGPSYQCSDLDDFTGDKDKPTWNTTEFNYSSVHDAFYKTIPQSEKDESNGFEQYQAEAVDFMPNTIMVWTKGPNTAHLVCQQYNTSYSVSVQYRDGIETIMPITIDTMELQTEVYDVFTAVHDDEPRTDTNVLGTYYVTQLLFQELLIANVTRGASNELSVYREEGGDRLKTVLDQSSLIYCPEISPVLEYDETDRSGMCRNGSLARAIEDLSHNYTYSTIAYFSGDSGPTERVPIKKWSPKNYYIYDQKTLLITYGAVFIATIIILILGAIAVWDNGYVGEAKFSSTMLTTRNADLDHLAQGRSLGSQALVKEVGAVKLQFGRIEDQDGTYRTTFGLEGTVEPLTKGGI